MLRLIPLLLLVLVACGTPQEQCIRRETSQLRPINTLITEVSGNLQRGYAIEREAYTVPVYKICRVEKDSAGNVTKREYCWDHETHYRNKSVAIDIGAEKRKLAGLQSKRAALIKATAPAVTQCKAEFPE